MQACVRRHGVAAFDLCQARMQLYTATSCTQPQTAGRGLGRRVRGAGHEARKTNTCRFQVENGIASQCARELGHATCNMRIALPSVDEAKASRMFRQLLLLTKAARDTLRACRHSAAPVRALRWKLDMRRP